MQQMNKCHRCGSPNAIGQRFCTVCGGRLEYRCIRCGSVIDPISAFCPNCKVEIAWQAGNKPVWVPQQARWTIPAVRKQSSQSKAFMGVILVIVLLGLGTLTYWAFASNMWDLSTFVETKTYVESATESEPQQPLTGFESQYQLPYVKTSDDPIRLINYPDAKDVSLAELKTFIYEDDTDKQLYIFGVRMCGHFAEEVHNNAERAGIKAALVIVDFADGSAPHALNAFQTTDYGLVYIDCTGVTKNPIAFEEWLYDLLRPIGQDRMAYVEINKPYGTINLDKAELPDYSFYVGFARGWSIIANYTFKPPGIVSNIQIFW